jgi:hypothetical protein
MPFHHRGLIRAPGAVIDRGVAGFRVALSQLPSLTVWLLTDVQRQKFDISFRAVYRRLDDSVNCQAE